MLIYVVLNILILLFMYIVHHRNIKNPTFLIAILFLLFFMISGFRYETVGGDTSTYITIYESSNIYEIPKISELFSSRFEVGFLIFNKFLYNISDNYTWMLASYALVTLSLYFFVMKRHSKQVMLSIFLFLTFLVYAYSLSNIRQSLSIALVLFSYHMITKGRTWSALVAIGIGTLFHTSAIVFVLVFFASKIKLTPKIMVIVSLLCVPLYVNMNSLMVYILGYSTKYQSYIDTDWFSSSNKLSIVLKFIIMLSIFLFGEIVLKHKKLNFSENLLRNLMFIGTIFSLFNMNTALIERFTIYFTVFLILYVPLIVSYIELNKIRVISMVVIIVFFMFYFYTILLLRPEWISITPYKNVLYNGVVEWLDQMFY